MVPQAFRLEDRQLAAWVDRTGSLELCRVCVFRYQNLRYVQVLRSNRSDTFFGSRLHPLFPLQESHALTGSVLFPSLAFAEAEPSASSEDASLKAAIC